MKFKDFLESANELLHDNPETGELDVCYSVDDEGNHFNNIFFSISVKPPEDDTENDRVCVN